MASTTDQSIVIGRRLAHFEVTGSLGKGGMGEVWQARDTKLGRDVAIKVLPESLAGDADRLARFEHEAKLLAALNHPNIAQIYGLETTDGVHALVLELVEGPTLAERIALGPLPAGEALGIAFQIANALEAAHAKSIVHRDLKPANIKLTDDGTVKVLDFGVAKALENPATHGLPESPALTTPAMTQAGIILGTAAYMSPEQARGKAVDARTDIWAFGCVLYEMLTGQPAFAGEDVAVTLARVIANDSDLDSLPAAISPAVRQTLMLCLQKDPRQRVADIRDVKLALEGAFDPGVSAAVPAQAAPNPLRARALPVAVAIAGTALAAALLAGNLWPAVDKPVTRFSVFLAAGLDFNAAGVGILDVSRGTRAFVYNTRQGIFVRALDELEAREIPGTSRAEVNAEAPILSPDGQRLAFFDTNTNQLRSLPVSGGVSTPLAAFSGVPLGASWSSDGSIWFALADGIHRVSETGGDAALIIATQGGEQFFGPQLLPGGDQLLFTVHQAMAPWSTAQIVVESIETHERARLIGGASARYLPTGHLIYEYDNDLYAAAFDPSAMTVSTPVLVVSGVMSGDATPGANYGVSDDGTLVYAAGAGPALDAYTLVWVDEAGHEEPLGVEPRNFGFVRVSHDGAKIATVISNGTNADIWVADTARPVLEPITFTPESEFLPLWPKDDNDTLYYSITGSNERRIERVRVDGTGSVEPLLSMEASLLATEGWSSDGGEIVFTYQNGPEPHIGLLELEPGSDGSRSWRPLIERDSDASALSVSPDGAWIAYQSDTSGEYSVYVERFPDPGNRTLVSEGWGPAWSRDGSELYYRRLGDGAMMGVDVETAPALKIGEPREVFPSQSYLPLITPLAGGPAGRGWDIGPDGKFLMIKGDTARPSREFVVVLNWLEELERLVPVD